MTKAVVTTAATAKKSNSNVAAVANHAYRDSFAATATTATSATYPQKDQSEERRTLLWSTEASNKRIQTLNRAQRKCRLDNFYKDPGTSAVLPLSRFFL